MKGARAEVEAVNWLRARGYDDARRYLAGDGRQPGDIDVLPGLVIDVKNRDGWKAREWLDQVELEAGPDRLGVVWARLERVVDPGAWPVLIRARQFFEMIELEPAIPWHPRAPEL